MQAIFDPDVYESRRDPLKGASLLWVLVVYQLIKNRFLRGLVRALQEHTLLQGAVGFAGGAQHLLQRLGSVSSGVDGGGLDVDRGTPL